MTKSLGASVDKATAFCTYCPKLCRFSCPAAEAENRETVTPWGLMRLLEYVRQGTVEPSEEIAEIFYHCMGCGRCQTWCKHQNDVPEAMWSARAWMHDLGHVPEVLDGFSDFFLDENSPHPTSKPLETGTESAFDENASIVFMPDCETRHHYPDLIPRAGRLLEHVLGDKVKLHTRSESKGHACCGFPLLSAGDLDSYDGYRAELEAALKDADYVITDCAAMVAQHREGGSFGESSPLDVRHLIEVLSDHAETLKPAAGVEIKAEGLVLHDSCFVGRHLNLYDETRTIAAAILGDIAEFNTNRSDAPCCGGAAHYHVVAPSASERCAKTRLEEMDREGGEQIVCGSATCKKAFRRVRSDDVAVDILELACRSVGV